MRVIPCNDMGAAEKSEKVDKRQVVPKTFGHLPHKRCQRWVLSCQQSVHATDTANKFKTYDHRYYRSQYHYSAKNRSKVGNRDAPAQGCKGNKGQAHDHQ